MYRSFKSTILLEKHLDWNIHHRNVLIRFRLAIHTETLTHRDIDTDMTCPNNVAFVVFYLKMNFIFFNLSNILGFKNKIPVLKIPIELFLVPRLV